MMHAHWKPVLLAALGGMVVSLVMSDPVQGGVAGESESQESASAQQGERQKGGDEQSEGRHLLHDHPSGVTKRNGRESDSGAVSKTFEKLDDEALRQVMLQLGDGIEQDRREWMKAIRDGKPVSEILFLQSILEREQLSLQKLRRSEYVLVPSAIAMANRKPGDPDFSAYPTTMMADGSKLYVKIAFSKTESVSLEGTEKSAGEQRWIEAISEIADHNRLPRADRKARVERGDEAKQKRALLIKERHSSSGTDLSVYMAKLEALRKQELPWYFKVDRMSYLASMPKWAKKFFEDLGGR